MTMTRKVRFPNPVGGRMNGLPLFNFSPATHNYHIGRERGLMEEQKENGLIIEGTQKASIVLW